MIKKILIFGSSGFIGCDLVKQLIKKIIKFALSVQIKIKPKKI